MDLIYGFLLIILIIILVIGVIRLVLEPSNNFADAIMQLFLIDWLIDMISGLFSILGDIFSDNDW